jgi:hypothetical protein
MNKEEYVKLTSAEISALWYTHVNLSVVICLFTHFLETCHDPDILKIQEDVLNLALKHKQEIEKLHLSEKMVVPEGFKVEKHVVTNTPKLFTDLFYIQCTLQICKFGLASHTAGFTLSARDDVRKLYKNLMDEVSQMYNQIISRMQEKGIYVRMPYMNYPSKVDFIDKKSILTGWFGRRRSLLGIEVTHLIENVMDNDLGKAICLGFSQVVQDEELREYFLRGKNLCKQISSSIHDVLEESEVPISVMWDQSVTTSNVAPFSDQLMLFIVGILSNLGIMSYGAGLSTSMRRDLSAMYGNFITKTGAFAEDGMDLMIERGWLEQPPQYEV